MSKEGVTKNMKFKLAPLLIILACSALVFPQSQEWIRSDQKDEIETFYQFEKIGTDRFEVKMMIRNNRSKDVRVHVQVQYESPQQTIRPFVPQSRTLYGQCEVTVPSGSTRICESIRVTAKKITGTKIIRWDNVDSKSNRPRGEPPPP
jgi:hypothetical protein